MHRLYYLLLSIILVICLCGCAQKIPQPVGVESPLAGKLGARLWLNSGQKFRLRFSGELQARGKTMDFTCFMVLDTGVRMVRIAVLGPFDVKLFTMDINLETHKILSGMPHVAGNKELTCAMAQAVRRIFLSPMPGDGNLVSGQDRDRFIVLEKPGKKTLVRFWFNEDENLEKSECLGVGNWQVRYGNWKTQDDWQVPFDYKYKDKIGFKLKLRLNEVRQ